MKLVALFLTMVPFNPGGQDYTWPLERKMSMRKETLEKITTWLCWSILMSGLGYAWSYYHWIMWVAANGLSL